MTIKQALHDFGVRPDTLLPNEKAQLDCDGYLALPNILTKSQIIYFRARLDELMAEEGENAGQEVNRESGIERVADLVNKDLMFQLPFTHPRVLAAAAYIFEGDVKLYSINSRTVLPGEGAQSLHTDYWEAVEPGNFQVCNTGWLLDDFTLENGPTRVVPGSHRWGKMPEQVLADPEQPHPDERLILASAGTVLIFNSHLWHSGTQNRTAHPRYAFHCAFCRRSLPQQTDQRKQLRPETRARLSEATRCILDVD